MVDEEPSRVQFENPLTLFRVINNLIGDRKVQAVDHMSKKTTCISVSVVQELKSKPDEMQIIGHVDVGEVRLLDLRCLVARMTVSLRSTMKWQLAGSKSIPTVPAVRLSNQQLAEASPPIPLEVGEDIPCSQVAVGPSSAIAPPAEADEMNTAMQALMRANAVVGTGTMSWLDSGISWSIAVAMYHAGFIEIYHEKEFDDHTFALKPEGVTWKPAHGLSNPEQIFVDLPKDDPPLKRCKLQLLLELHFEGFQTGDPQEPLSDVSPLIYRGRYRCVSYYACLLLRATIWVKTQFIRHDQVDNYYRCLLHIKPLSMRMILYESEGKGDQWFKERLTLAENLEYDHVTGVGSKRGRLQRRAAIADEDSVPEFLAPPIADEVTEENSMTRCVAHIGGDSCRVRIYFDQFRYHSGKQRGFMRCMTHGCLRQRQVESTDRATFVAEMYAWHQLRDIETVTDKRTHFAATPSPESIAMVQQSLVMEDF